MGKIGKAGMLAGLGITALVFSGSASASIPLEMGAPTGVGKCVVASTCDRTGAQNVLLAKSGNGKGGGKWSKSNNSSGKGGYGVQDGSGAAPRPQDGTGYGATKGSGTGACDGTGPKGKGRGGR
ncbi:MAG: hypothetical protein ACLFUT_09630 [Desulfobacteraceae bacterium]